MGFFDIFKRPARAPKAPLLAVKYSGAGISVVMAETGHANLFPVIAEEVVDFRGINDCTVVVELRQVQGATWVYAKGRPVGVLPDFWQPAGQVLMSRVAELGGNRVMVRGEAAWPRKAGPYTLKVALGHSERVAELPLVPYSQVPW